AGGEEKKGDQEYAIDEALDRGGGETERNAQIIPMRQQITADQFARAQRQNFVSEKPDVNRLRRTPESEADHRLEQRLPSPCLDEVTAHFASGRERDPAPIQLTQGRQQFFPQRISVQYPQEADGGKEATGRLRRP